jgi:hypothetical protein
MSKVCATCLSCDVQVLSVEKVDGNGEGQASSCWWTRIDEGETWSLGPRDQGSKDGPWMTNTWLRWQASVHAMECRQYWPKSRLWLTKSRWVHEHLVIGWLRTSSDTHRNRRGGVANTRLQLSLVVLASIPHAAGLPGLGLKTHGKIPRQQAVSSESLHRGEASSWRERGCLVSRTQLGPFHPRVKWFRENV